MPDHPELIISVTAYPSSPEEATRAAEAFSRTACGLALDGIGLSLAMTPLDEEGVAREVICEHRPEDG